MTTTDLSAAPPSTPPATGATAPRTGLPAAIGVITQRELTVKLRDKAFIGSTIFLLLTVAVSIVLPTLLNRGNPAITLGAVGPRAAAVASDAARLGRLADQPKDSRGDATGLDAARISVRTFTDPASAQDAVRGGTVKAALVPASASAPSGALVLVGDTTLPAELSPLVDAAARRQAVTDALTGDGLSADAANRALTGASAAGPAQRLLDPPAADRNVSFGLGVAFSMVFFLASLLFGLSIAQSVVEEKQSRVVEILVAAVPVRALLAGKVAANTALALGQTVLLAGVGMAGAGLVGQGTLIGLILRSGGWFLLFFVLGFTMLASLWAAGGAVASRIEDLNATTMPMQILLYLPFFAAVWVHDPGPAMRILSYIPFTAPLSMPQRLMIGDAAWWEAPISAAIVVVTAAGIVSVAARIYERNVLRTSGRVPWRAAWSG